MPAHSMSSDEAMHSPDPASEASAGSPTPAAAEPAASRKGAAPASSSSSSSSNSTAPAKKRSASAADLSSSSAPPKVTKRRAARACVSCRARKVRCDVVEGAPCGNCRWDNVECVVQESRRRRKNLLAAAASASAGHVVSAEAQLRSKNNPISITSADLRADLRRPSEGSVVSLASLEANGAAGLLGGASAGAMEGHVPHLLYQRTGYQHDALQLGKLPSAADGSQQRRLLAGLLNQASLFGDLRTAKFLSSLEEPDLLGQLPPFVRALPPKIAAEDVRYLHAKGALTLPELPLQNALLQAYVEYVHPYMPLMELHDFLGMVNSRDGLCGQVSLLLYQAVMFAATAFVDMRPLRDAGYSTRKAARKAFFQKTRLLYDFDYESDRLILVQALLLMTYWYETPDDQKDTWHWMGVAISLAHTIGLHRNPAVMSMPQRKQKLWKRIWWSCFMRDRLVALGMRRPTRIKDEDFDVPMLEEADFELDVLAQDNAVIPPGCLLMRDVAMQQELALMCIAKARLCVCISHMLKAQYSVLIRDRAKADDTVNSTMMLLPNKKLDNVESVASVDLELLAWADSLPACCQYRPLTPLDVKNGRSTVAVQRTLLHMVYYTTISALHRPQFLPSSPLSAPTVSRQVQEMSRLRVRDAAMHTTRMAAELHQCRLERYLPTTGVTVILPAMIIHLLEMKNPIQQARDRAIKGFRQCMKVLEKLRELYSAADYATGFLDAALRKAAIDLNLTAHSSSSAAAPTNPNMKASAFPYSAQTPPPENAPYMTAAESLFASAAAHQGPLMPPLTTTAAALELSATSPPQTDLDSAVGELTPSASGSSEAAALDGLDFGVGQHDFDWNAVAGAEFDVDQWLQFPTEGAGAADDVFVAGVMADDVAMTTEQALSWALNAEIAQEGIEVE